MRIKRNMRRKRNRRQLCEETSHEIVIQTQPNEARTAKPVPYGKCNDDIEGKQNGLVTVPQSIETKHKK